MAIKWTCENWHFRRFKLQSSKALTSNYRLYQSIRCLWPWTVCLDVLLVVMSYCLYLCLSVCMCLCVCVCTSVCLSVSAGVMAVEVVSWQWWTMDRPVSAAWLDVDSLHVALRQVRLEASLHRKHHLTEENCNASGRSHHYPWVQDGFCVTFVSFIQ